MFNSENDSAVAVGCVYNMLLADVFFEANKHRRTVIESQHDMSVL